ncbi:MAG: hypothetical protein IPK33_03155 [Gemmatimonadetes bacterium]|nr:hypothetical protein [Gemmatimonadota bacterium]
MHSTPFWVGATDGVDLRIDHPAVRPRHIAILEREDGYWLVPGDGTASIRGRAIGHGVVLVPGDEIEIARGCKLRFGEAEEVSPREVRPASTPLVRPRRRTLGQRLPKWNLSPRVSFLVAGAALALCIAGLLVYRAMSVTAVDKNALTLEQELVLDSLLGEAYDRIERGSSLLEIGANEAALRQFADGINVLQLHPLHRHPSVVRTVLALEGSVAALYRSRRLAVPPSYARAPTSGGPVGSSRVASLSIEAFATAFQEVQLVYQKTFGDSITVTGRDHSEHMSLYGAGGALDLRSRHLSPDRLRFIVDSCLRRGIRVKDFSSDEILRAQINAAIRAGLPERAGTGLHLHIDRYAGRRDRWTVNPSR